MAPSTSSSAAAAARTKNNAHYSENLNPQRPYQSLTRKGIVALSSSSSSTSASSSSSRSRVNKTRPSSLVVDPSDDVARHRQQQRQQHQQRRQQPRGNEGGPTTKKKTGIERSYDSLSRALPPSPRVAVPSAAGGTTGIERSYDSMTRTLKSLGSFGTTTSRSGNSNDGGGGGGPPAPVASASFSTTGGDDRSSGMHYLHSAQMIGEHLRSISASMSYDDYERLRDESRRLKAAHEARYSAHNAIATSAVVASTSTAVENGRGLLGHSTSTALIANGHRNEKSGRTSGASEEEEEEDRRRTSRGSSGMYSARLGDGVVGGGGRLITTKGVVKMTSEGLHKIRDILNIANSSDMDEMSFFYSDGDTGNVMKKKFSLNPDNGRDGGGDRIDAVDRIVEGAPPQSTAAFAVSVVGAVAGVVARDVAPRLSAGVAHAADVVVRDVAPRVGAGVAHAAKNVVKVTRQGVGGAAGMLAKDIANAKTPARSNVTGQRGIDYGVAGARARTTRHADYVHDPYYKVVATPVNEGGAVRADAPHAAYCDPKTPACLVGAIVAGRCDLPDSHPDSLEYHPGGIPRVLVVHDDWEERAGFVPSAADLNARGDDGNVRLAAESKAEVSRDRRRISNPIDVDEETETINGEEVNVEEMWALRQGRETPTNAAAAKDGINANKFNYDGDVEVEEVSEGHESDDEDGSDRLRNASMWVAVPENYMEEDAPDDNLDNTMCVGDIRMGDLLLEDGYEGGDVDNDEDDDECVNVGDIYMGDFLNDGSNERKAREKGGVELITPLSIGEKTFFVGDVHVGFDSPEDTKAEKIVAANRESLVVENVSSDDEEELVYDAKRLSRNNKSNLNNAVFAPKTQATIPATKIEDFDVCHNRKSSQEPPVIANSFREDESLASFAKSITAAVISDQHRLTKKEFETPYSVKKGERPLTFTEFKAMNKQVLFDLKDGDRIYHWERPAELGENHALQPSDSTELSHEPPMRMVDSGAQELYVRPSESTDLSLYSNWAVPPNIKDPASGKRQLKGRIILVRIKKKISKVAKKLIFYSWKKKDCHEDTDNNNFIASHPISDYAIPGSPSAASVMSVTSSIMTGSGTKRIIGAVPSKIGSPCTAMYGVVNYGNRGSPESSGGGYDSLPAPPECMPLPRASKDEEDAVSYLAEAMRHSQGNGDEDSVLLLVTPKDDGTGEDVQVISATDGTPVPFREIIDAISESSNKDDKPSTSGFKPNNLSCLFTDEKGGNATIEIMDAVEFNGGIVLTPQHVNHNLTRVFRPSTESSSANLLPGSLVCDSEDEDETLYHDGCTVIHQTSTFGDNTIATIEAASKAEPGLSKMGSKKTPSAVSNMGIGTPILSPDGPPLTRQASVNGSFLFSPDNMGRADPIIRAKERASSKVCNVKPSITMLPSAKMKKTTNHVGENEALVTRSSYSRSSIETYETNEVPIKKQVMSSVTEDRQFPFHAILNKFSADASLEDVCSLRRDGDEACNASSAVHQDDSPNAPTFSTEILTVTSDEAEEMNTPPFASAATRKTFPKTPFPKNEMKTAASEESSPALVVAVNNVSSSSSNVSISSFTSAKSVSSSRKRSPPQDKTVPKSALKTRKGFVKDRVCDIQQRISVPDALLSPNGAVTDVNGRLKRNHSYRLKKTRRTTNGNGALAPHKAVLRTTYIRSVPIAIAKSYSRDSREEKSSFGEDLKDEACSYFAPKYTAESAAAKTNVKGKHVTTFDRSSPNSVEAGSMSDASSYVSETTDCDPFNSLLGKMTSEDEESSSSEEEKEGDVYTEREENSDDAKSPSAHLPFKSTTLVKPTEINLREERVSPVPMHARAWREMAVKAALDKEHSARFRSEKSWKEIVR